MKIKEMTIDLETAGTPSNVPGKRDLVAILSVGIVVFDASVVQGFNSIQGKLAESSIEDAAHEQLILDNSLYTPVSFMQSLSHGFNVDPGTLEFWNEQAAKEGGYNMIAAASEFTEDIKFTFAKIEQFLKQHKDAKRVWMRDQSFDGTILREAMNHLGFVMPLSPFTFRDHRCLTDKDLYAEEYPALQQNQMRHHALHDAAIQSMMRQTQRFKVEAGRAPAVASKEN